MANTGDPSDIDTGDIEYNTATETYHLTYDLGQTTRPTLVILHFIAVLLDEPIMSIPKINRAISSDALDGLVTGETARTADLEVSFTYAGYRITVVATGEIRARQMKDESSEL